MNISTADLSDEFGDALSYCDTPFVQYGLHKSFAGAITTVRCVEDNALLRSVLETPGRGGVVVVDGAGSTRVALLGDMMAQLAIDNGWAGVIINGAVRYVKDGGWLLMEHGYDQAAAVQGLLQALPFESVQSWQDLAGIERVSGGRFKKTM